MSEEDIKVSDGEEEQELSKEERLEAARKKFEELKKKKKKGKKKSKKESDSVEPSVEPEDQEDSEKKDAEEAEQVAEAEVAQTETEKKELATEESKEELATEESKEEDVPVAAPVAEVLATEAQVPEPVNSTPSELKEAIIPPTKDEVTKPALASDESLIIQQLNETIEQQKNTIKKLRDDNTDLKLFKMDLLDRISELELLTEQLKKSGGISKVQVPTKVVPAEPVFKTNDFASESTQNLAVSATDDFREKLMVWKGWQADMTNWGGVQTQIVKL